MVGCAFTLNTSTNAKLFQNFTTRASGKPAFPAISDSFKLLHSIETAMNPGLQKGKTATTAKPNSTSAKSSESSKASQPGWQSLVCEQCGRYKQTVDIECKLCKQFFSEPTRITSRGVQYCSTSGFCARCLKKLGSRKNGTWEVDPLSCVLSLVGIMLLLKTVKTAFELANETYTLL